MPSAMLCVRAFAQAPASRSWIQMPVTPRLSHVPGVTVLAKSI